MKIEITLIRKQDTPFTVNYPFQLPDGRLTRFDWSGTKGKVQNERNVPVEVYEWLRDYTTTFTEGELIVKTLDEKDTELSEDVKYLVEDMNSQQEDISQSIMTREEIEEMLTKGNQNVLKGKLNKLLEGLDEEQIKNVKGYIYRTAIDIGVDSNAKRKVICDWYGCNVEDCGFVFDKEE